MTQKANPPQDEDATRVVLFRTQAVGIVDKAANGEVFLAMKSAGMEGQTEAGAPADATKAPPAPLAPPPAAAMKMPAAMKAAMTEALGAVLDTCAKMAEELEKAELDETAPPPMPLLKMAMEAADKLDAMVEPYEEAMMAAPPPAEGETAQKAAPAEGMKPRPKMAMKRIMAMEGVAKALTTNAAEVEKLVAWAKGAAGMPPPAMTDKGIPAQKADLDPYTAMVATSDAVRERMYKIKGLLESDPAAVANELRQLIPMVDSLAMLVTQARSGAMAPPAGAPPMAPMPAPMDAEVVQKAVAAGVESMKTDLLATVEAKVSGLVLAAKSAATSAQAALLRVEKSVPAPNGQPAGENPAPSAGAPPPADPWRTINQDIQQARTPAAGK